MWSGNTFRDSYSTTIKILDENDNVLSITTMTRNNDGVIGLTLTHIQIQQLIQIQAKKMGQQWQGIDGNSPNSTSPVGPNLLGASLTATLLDITYTPISEETTEQLEETNELLEENKKI